MKILKVVLLNLLLAAFALLLIEAAIALNTEASGRKSAYFQKIFETNYYQKMTLTGPWHMSQVLSPFFGYGTEHNQHAKASGAFDNNDIFKINNYKFLSPFDYPYVKKENEIVIGVFGGSFAFNWAAFESRTGEFARALPLKIPQLKNKKIVLLNMSHSGYKQPQQYYVFAYFYEMLDAVIAIDGFNEIFVNPSFGFPFEFPVYSIKFHPLVKNEHRENLVEQNRKLRNIINTIHHTLLAHPWMSKSYLFYVYHSSLNAFLKEKINRINLLLAEPNGQSFYEKEISEKEKPAVLADIWAKYTVMTHDVAKKNNIKMFHFLQPNQYLNAKPLSATEMKIAYNSEVKPRVETGYAQLLIRQKALLAKNYNVSTELINAYVNESASLYSDACCHVNDTGNALLTDRLLSLVARDW